MHAHQNLACANLGHLHSFQPYILLAAIDSRAHLPGNHTSRNRHFAFENRFHLVNSVCL
jgi:hypothetical protein